MTFKTKSNYVKGQNLRKLQNTKIDIQMIQNNQRHVINQKDKHFK